MTFRVGQKVVCIKRGQWVVAGSNRPTSVPGPKYGDIVTIDGITHDGYLYVHTELGRIGLFINQGNGKAGRKCYDPSQFRPLVEPKGMQVLRSILKNPKQKIKSDQFGKEKV